MLFLYSLPVRSFWLINFAFTGSERTGEVDEDGEYEVIVVDQNNSSILASSDHCPSSTTSSGPPSLKVRKPNCDLQVLYEFKEFI